MPRSGTGEDVLLGDVVISKTVVQYDLGRQFPNGFVMRDTVDDRLGRPTKHIRNLLVVFETDLARERLEKRVAMFLENIQRRATARKRR